MVKLIIFDFDGVIVTGTNEGYFRCYHQALESVGVRLPAAEERKRILAWWGRGYQNQLKLLLEEHPDKLTQAIVAYEYIYHQTPTFTQNIRLIEGVSNTLADLSKRYTLAIASGMMRKTMDWLLERFSLAKFFHAVLTIDDVPREEDRKPSPYMLNQIMRQTSFDPFETVCVGDAGVDVTMARNACVTPVVVLTGHLSENEAQALGVKYIVPDITHLPKLLGTIEL